MKILVLNCGSSSIKYKLFDMTTKEVLAQGGIEKIGLVGSFLKLTLPNGEKKILEKVFQKKIDIMTIEPNFYCDYGFNIFLGKNFYSNHNLVILDANRVEFGDNVFVGPNCGFYTSGHPLDYEIRNKGLEYAKPIKVGNNVWIGGNVCVMPGVTIGDNVVIGAGSVVTKDIPSNVVAVGNPCKTLKEI